MIHSLVFLPVQIQAALIAAIVAVLIQLYNYIRTTKPLLVFIRRPTRIWRIKNIGHGAAFNVYFRDIGGEGDKQDYRIYPVADGEEVQLTGLKLGDVLEVYFTDWTGWRKYRTTCKKWDNDVERIWFGWRKVERDFSNATDESRLYPPEVPPATK
jgi:hypothetical protein